MEQSQQTSQRWTIKKILEWTADYFRDRGIESARLDAEVLLAHCLGEERIHLYLNLDRPLTPDERSRYRELVRRRVQREPVARIVGTKEFWSISVQTPPGVLIPRPDTEILVEVVLEAARTCSGAWILEIGTGSGAVAVALAKELPAARIVAADIEPAILRIAADNAQRAAVRGTVDFVASDLFAAFRPFGYFDVICSNPPYIPSDTIATLEPEVRLFDPLRALDGGPDGLAVIRPLVSRAGAYLKDGGELFLEVGDGQAEMVAELFAAPGGLRDIRTLNDLGGRPRVIGGRK